MRKELKEKEAGDFLEKEGFEVSKTELAKSEEDIKIIEKKLRFPWAMKVLSKTIVHKAKSGGVILDIDSQIKAQEAFDKLSELEGFQAAVIQEMSSGEEAIMGLKKTPEFGVVIMFGKGGVKVEEERDISFRVLPISKKEAERMIKETKFYKTIEQKNISIEMLKALLIKISKLVEKHPSIVELDVNPVMLASKNAEIVDARLAFEE